MKKENTAKKSSSSSNSNAKPGASKKITGKSNVKSSSSKKSSSSPSEDLKKIFEDELKDIYWAEKHLTKALPKMAKAATHEDLKAAFQEHYEQTQEHVSRVEQVFEICDIKPQAKKCEAMEGLVEEAQEMIEDHDAGIVRDAGLIIGAQKVEHYEIAAYGSLRNLAEVLGYDDAAELLQTTLDEEGETDKNLTSLSETINKMAMENSSEEVEEDEESMA